VVDYTLIRSRRRTIGLQVHRDGSVIVRAPMRLAKRDIERFVLSHEAWIAKHRERMANEPDANPPFTFADGDCLPLFGEELTLAPGGKRVMRQGNSLLVPEGADREKALTEFLREEARGAAMALIARWSALMGVIPKGVKITSAATRWGSCSGKNRLCFSWRVACLPPALIEYIVVHELAHIREHNHSARFWATVGEALPDYENRRAALRGWQRRIPL
jgi:predicted metal-dependent hydrolase